MTCSTRGGEKTKGKQKPGMGDRGAKKSVRLRVGIEIKKSEGPGERGKEKKILSKKVGVSNQRVMTKKKGVLGSGGQKLGK